MEIMIDPNIGNQDHILRCIAYPESIENVIALEILLIPDIFWRDCTFCVDIGLYIFGCEANFIKKFCLGFIRYNFMPQSHSFLDPPNLENIMHPSKAEMIDSYQDKKSALREGRIGGFCGGRDWENN